MNVILRFTIPEEGVLGTPCIPGLVSVVTVDFDSAVPVLARPSWGRADPVAINTRHRNANPFFIP
jgi:hypothetical protein